jgi:hypothetical protein
MRSFLHNTKLSVPIGLALLAGIAWVAFGYFGAHRLVVDDRVSEAPPAFALESGDVVTEYRGDFVGLEHDTSGDAIVLADGSGERFLRFEAFETSNGPDVNVYLVNSEADGIDDSIDLGDLKGNIGDQNYAIPAGVDLDRYDTVLIWCVRFSAPFGQADLAAS